nr:MAG TPA: hypothetical protein [Bacteriophage sp.]
MSCPICGKQSLSASNHYCKDHENIVQASMPDTIETVTNKYVSLKGFEYIVDKLNLKIETLNKENIAMTEDMCQNAYELAVEDIKQDIKDVYYSLNWFQRLLWRILGLNRLWLNEK